MHRLLQRQLAKARTPAGDVDVDRLCALIATTYAQFDTERLRSDRATRLLVEEVDAVNLARDNALGELSAQNLRMDAALNNMAQGLAMFDASHRLVIANAQFAKLYDLDVAQVIPGTHVHQLVDYRVGMGHCGDASAAEINDRVLQSFPCTGAAHFVTKLTPKGASARFVAVTVQPMLDGGWVTTHQDITERRHAEARIAHMALHDSLTDLPNRILLHERLTHALAGIGPEASVAIHFLDLDHFKNVNDTLGHAIGDKLLAQVAVRLRAVVAATDTVARMGGDEFAIVQRSLSAVADAKQLAEAVIEAVSRPYDIEGQQVIVGTSLGITVAPSDGLDPEELLRNADLALYRAKDDGRGTFRFFETGMDVQMQVRRLLEQDLRNALRVGQFELHYQPIADAVTGRIATFEALIRWQHPERGLIPPSAFIPLAEDNGLICPIGAWAIKTACAAAVEWPQDIRVAVNLSPGQLRAPGIVQVVADALAASGLDPHRLELEITETALLRDEADTLAILTALRALGVRIAMDDFGTGYSSLSHLYKFPFDKIKIDRSFIAGMRDSETARNIVRAIATMARGMGVESTAEGVETACQLDAVTAEGCSQLQGFLLSRPVPVELIPGLLFRGSLKPVRASAAA